MVKPTGQGAAGDLRGLMVVYAEEFVVAPGVPWEAVDAVEAEDVVDAEHAEDLGEVAEAGAPPGEAVCGHGVPIVEGDAPVLAPLVDEGVLGIVAFWGDAAEPIGVEAVAIKKHICGVEGDADGDVSHELDAEGVCMGAQGEPLAEAEPLDVGEVAELGGDGGGVFGAKIGDVGEGTIWGAARFWPLVPGEFWAVDFDH